MTAVQTDSSLRTRCMGVRAASQSLKSPTSDTVVARGATTTKPNSLTEAGREGRSGRHSTTATNTAATASAPNGKKGTVRGRVSQPQAAWAAPPDRRAGRLAICAITRASSPASTVTGRRSWRTTRPISSSSGSNTFRLSENRLQLLARPLHAHLERRHARTRQPRHLFVFEILDVLEEERFPVFRGQPRQRPPHHVLALGLLGGARVGDAVERGLVTHEAAPAGARRLPGSCPAQRARRARYRAPSVAYASVSPPSTRRTASTSLVPTLSIPMRAPAPSHSGRAVGRCDPGRRVEVS